MAQRLVNPSDLLDAIVLVDKITDALRTTRVGLRSTRQNWRTSSAGLLTAARAASSLAALTEEYSALLLFMVMNGSEISPEVAKTLSLLSPTYSQSLVIDDDQERTDEI